MLSELGRWLSRLPQGVVWTWVGLVLGVTLIVPPHRQATREDQLRFLPEQAPSRAAEQLYRSAFSKDLLSSSVFVVARRLGGDEGLLHEDRTFVETVLKPRIEAVAGFTGNRGHEAIVGRVRTSTDPYIGELLDSEDGRATLVVVEFTGAFYERQNWPTIRRIEAVVAQSGPDISKPGNLFSEGLVPPGLSLETSGTATVGRDLSRAAEHSETAIERWAILLAVCLLVGIYRSPVLSAIPLVTVFLGTQVALGLLRMAADWGWVTLAGGIETYLVVLLYGTGLGFCIVIVNRYREELEAGRTFEDGMAIAVTRTGPPVLAAAATTVGSVGAMIFADLAKFHQAGMTMAFGMVVVMLAALTLTPALLLTLRRWAFWPDVRSEYVSLDSTWWPRRPHGLPADSRTPRFWERWAGSVLRRPIVWSLATLAALTPWAAVAVSSWNDVTYSLLAELPSGVPSIAGARAVQDHFPAGATGPVTLLVRHPDVDFGLTDGKALIAELSRQLGRHAEAVGITDIRSVAYPLGMHEERELNEATHRRLLRHHKALAHYVSDQGPWAGHVTKLDIVLRDDPFSRESLQRFERLKQIVDNERPAALQEAELHYLGPTALVSDLRRVTRADRARVNAIAVAAVAVVLYSLVRRIGLTLFLLGTTMLTWLVTLGVTSLTFAALTGDDFPGLDWKVGMFLFTILVAVGPDLQLFLISRYDEERRTHDPTRGLVDAAMRTGTTLSWCGVVTAISFASLLAASLVGMQQLGFALVVGLLLNTFIVRTVFVPAWLEVVESGRWNVWPRGLRQSGQADSKSSAVTPVTATDDG